MSKKAFLCFLVFCLFLTVSCAMERQQQYIKSHPELKSKIKTAIENGEIIIGMTKEQVLASRGRPFNINKTTTENMVYEQWVYYDSDLVILTPKISKYAYVYFENGKVTSWQSMRWA